MTQATYVYIHSNGRFVPAGLLEMHGRGRDSYATFQYGKQYLKRTDALPVDPVSLPLRDGPFTTEAGPGALFGAIRDAAPDGWGRHILDQAAAAEGKVLTEFDYLASSGDDRVGALAFGPDLDGPQRVFPFQIPGNKPFAGEALDLEQMLAAAESVESEAELPPQHRRFLVRGSSGLGGAQPKASTYFEGRHWVAKFGRKHDVWSTCRVEQATMELARLCNITVPQTRVLTMAGRDVYLIERFDRQTDARQHYISARSLLGVQTEPGSSSKEGWPDHTKSYQDIANQFRIYGSARNLREDLEQLYRRMVFNVLCNNYDDHLRNHGFLYDGKGWRPSPAFDIVAQPEGMDIRPLLCLGVGDNGRQATIENALSRPDPFGLDDDDAREVINEMALTVKHNWRDVFKKCGVPRQLFNELQQVSFANAENFQPAEPYNGPRV